MMRKKKNIQSNKKSNLFLFYYVVFFSLILERRKEILIYSISRKTEKHQHPQINIVMSVRKMGLTNESILRATFIDYTRILTTTKTNEKLIMETLQNNCNFLFVFDIVSNKTYGAWWVIYLEDTFFLSKKNHYFF
jgi:hypothetical protein